MKLIDVVTAPWAIQPEKLLEIQAIYATHLRGEKIDVAAVEQRLGRQLRNEQRDYDIRDGVAVVPLEGVMAKRANLFMQISGGVSMEIAARTLRDAAADQDAHSIVLLIDSPGGTVDGTQALAAVVAEVAAIKPVVAVASGTMASAAYWVGSAAQRVYVADNTTVVGSIGVVATHVDVSHAEAAMGRKTTEIVAGKYKRIASQYGPLTEEGRATMQEQVDYTYSVFVRDVARHRGVSEEKVLQSMADGRLFIGEQAVAAGLVDGVSTLDAVIASLNDQRAGAAPPVNVQHQEQSMKLSKEQIEADAPDLVKAWRDEGAAAEVARANGVRAALIPGHEALISQLAADGKTTPEEAKTAVIAAEVELRKKAGASSAAEAPGAVPLAPVAPVPAAAAPVDPSDAEAFEASCKAEWEKGAQVRAEFGAFATYLAYRKATAAGNVRILSK